MPDLEAKMQIAINRRESKIHFGKIRVDTPAEACARVAQSAIDLAVAEAVKKEREPVVELIRMVQEAVEAFFTGTCYDDYDEPLKDLRRWLAALEALQETPDES